MKKIAFIGAGKMAEALIAHLPGVKNIIVSDINKSRLKYLKQKYHVRTIEDNFEAFFAADIIILAVKPQNMAEVITELKAESFKFHGSYKLLISIAAGISLDYLEKHLAGLAIVRAMPNNPCLVGMGITALSKGKKVAKKQFEEAENIFKAVGETVIVPEKWMHAVTGLSGSGPAYVYAAIEALTLGGVAEGLPRPVGLKLAVQTVLGSAAAIIKTGKSPQELTAMVASPGGTTIEGLKILKKHKHGKALASAVRAAAQKSRQLSK